MKLLALASAGLLLPVFALGALAQDTAPETEAGEETSQESETGDMGDAESDAGGDSAQAWFTAEQADTGQRTFAISCGGCHGTDMADVFATYDTAEEYFLFASGSMPADNPGSLANQQYVDIIAYLMRENGFPAGDEELPADREILAQIIPSEAPEAGEAEGEEDGEVEGEAEDAEATEG